MALVAVCALLCVVGVSAGCSFPWGTRSCSLITKDYAVVSPHKVDKCMAIGGMLFDGSPKDKGIMQGNVRYKSIQPVNKNNWQFKQGFSVGPSSFDFTKFAAIARTAQSGNAGNYKVISVTKGGSYNMYNFRPNGGAKDNGKTLVIFNTSDPIVITKTPDGKAFGPSILAPFSQVTLAADAGFIDGCVIANQFVSSGPGSQNLQLHGNCYQGPINCRAPPSLAGKSVGGSPSAGIGKCKNMCWWKGLLIGVSSLMGAGLIGGGAYVAVKRKQMLSVPICAPSPNGPKPPMPPCAAPPPSTQTGGSNGGQGSKQGQSGSKQGQSGSSQASKSIKITSKNSKSLRLYDSDALEQVSDADSNAFERGQAFAATWFIPILACGLLLSIVAGLAGLSRIHKAWKRRQISAENIDIALE